MKPIVLTEHGETLVLDSAFGRSTKNLTDRSGLMPMLGQHGVCKGFLEIKPVSETHFAIVCNDCHLRIVVPNTVKTFGQLRRHFRRFNT
jgi:hypothetical protein